MKKLLILSTIAALSMSTIGLSQAEDVLETPVSTSISDVADAKEADSAEELLDEPMAAANTEDPVVAAVDEEPIPQDSPQVQKLMKWYPNLVARIQPYGQVCYEGEDCDITLTASGGSADGEPRDGKAVYNQVCQTCHGAGLLGAPVFGDAGAWGARIAKGQDTLYDHAINGFNAMPAKGGADIPDEEVQNAVDYMIENAS